METQSGQALLEKGNWEICFLQSCHKPSKHTIYEVHKANHNKMRYARTQDLKPIQREVNDCIFSYLDNKKFNFFFLPRNQAIYHLVISFKHLRFMQHYAFHLPIFTGPRFCFLSFYAHLKHILVVVNFKIKE